MALPPADATQVAAILAAATGLAAALVGIVNLILTVRRERPQLTVFVRRWSAGQHGEERFVAVLATNVGRRPLTVVTMGLRLETGDRHWRAEDGTPSPPLPARLEEGATVVMTWLSEELGPEHYSGDARIIECFAVDGRGRTARAPVK